MEVLVAANAEENECTVFKPVEYIFPEGREYKTYALKTSELHPDCNVPCNDPVIEKDLREAALKIFKGFRCLSFVNFVVIYIQVY